MPRKISMGFEPGPRRWRKMYKGVRYEVYCAALKLPEEQWTELGSYRAANDWWAAKKAGVDATPPRLRPDVEGVVETLRAKRRALAQAGEDASEYDDAIAAAEAAAAGPLIGPGVKFASVEEEVDAVGKAPQPGGDGVNVLDPRTTARAAYLSSLGVDLSGLDAASLEIGLGSAEYWQGRLARVEAVPDGRRVGALLDGWLASKKKRATATTLVRLQGLKKEFASLKHGGRAVLSADMPADVLTEQKVEEVFRALDGQAHKEDTKRKKWLTFKNFIRHAVARRVIPHPLNLDSADLAFDVVLEQKPKPVMADVRAFLGALPDRLRLYALLASNCGLNNVDIGKLAPGQVDLAAGVLTRRRVKTGKHKRVPTVTYSLWPETVELLRREMAAGGEYALLDAKGRPLYVDTKDGPKGAALYDKIAASWRDRLNRKGGTYTLKDFRFIGADLIRGGPYRTYQEAWLGHSPRTVAARHYSSAEDCTEVCRWLRTQFFPDAAAVVPASGSEAK